MINIIIINGYPGSGKDEFINFVIKNFNDTYNVKNISSVEFTKNKLAELWNITDFKNPNVRNIISYLKNNSDSDDKYILNEIDKIYKLSILDNVNYLIFVHIREPNKIKSFINELDSNTYIITTLFINRNIKLDNNIKNDSDLNVLNYKYDYIIDNNGTLEDLDLNTINFIKNII